MESLSQPVNKLFTASCWHASVSPRFLHKMLILTNFSKTKTSDGVESAG